MAGRPGDINKAHAPVVIALAGALSLSVAMGIGRFAFTPLLPMMLHDGIIDINGGSLLATMNYIGYLLGAFLCMLLPALCARAGVKFPGNVVMVRGGLVATALLTLAMALHIPSLWPVLRLLSGVVSAIVFVYTSGWCLSRLAGSGNAALGGVIYTGPGAGIALSGLAAFAIARAEGSAAVTWAGFGILAAALSALIWPVFNDARGAVAAAAPATGAGQGKPMGTEPLLLVLAYGLAGFGYIVTATFLPVIAREAIAGSFWIELFWPVFGIGVMVGALATRHIPLRIDRRTLLAGCYVMQAAGVAATLLLPSIGGFLLGSALVGIPFTAITLFGIQEARRLRPDTLTTFIALMTAAYGIGQIAGPPMVSMILAHSANHAAGFALSLEIAASSLAAGAAIYIAMIFMFPADRPG